MKIIPAFWSLAAFLYYFDTIWYRSDVRAYCPQALISTLINRDYPSFSCASGLSRFFL